MNSVANLSSQIRTGAMSQQSDVTDGPHAKFLKSLVVSINECRQVKTLMLHKQKRPLMVTIDKLVSLY